MLWADAPDADDRLEEGLSNVCEAAGEGDPDGVCRCRDCPMLPL